MDVDGFCGRDEPSFRSCVVWAGGSVCFHYRRWYSDPLARGRQAEGDSPRQKKSLRIPDRGWVMWEFSFFFFGHSLFVFNLLCSVSTSWGLYFPISAAEMHSDAALQSLHNGMPLTLRAAHSQTIHVPTHAYKRWRTCPQPPSPLDLLSYLKTLYSFPPSGNSFHVNTTSICRPALSLHTSIAAPLISVTFRENKWCLYPSCLTA